MATLRFNFKDIVDLNADLKASPKALSAVVQRVTALHLRRLRAQMKPAVPRGATGKLAASFGTSVRRRGANVSAVFGFLLGKRISASTAIAGNVLQRPGATARKREHLWIPALLNRAAGGGAIVTPAEFFARPNTFIRAVGGGKKMAFQRIGDSIIPMFVLQKSVSMRAQPLNLQSNVEGVVPEIIDDIKDTIHQVLAARGAVVRSANGG